MRLEALELVIRGQIRILVIEMHDESDRYEVVAEVIDERAAPGIRIERPALAVQHEAFLVLAGRGLPQFLDADAVFLRIYAVAQIESPHEFLRQRSTRTFREKRVPGVQ